MIEDKTFENEVDKSSEKTPNHGGKREGSGRPFGSKSKPSQWKLNTNILLWIICYLC